ncbi:MAG TPA: 3-phenylpropionate/cinnamic acid dioxygenase subunit beta [Pseudonocardia sp.]|jgi:biphenyl 2,3-dioxygenase beta subunit
MTIDESVRTDGDLQARVVRQYLVERFYSDEAALLDAHRYPEWVELFSEDTHYFMPIRRTRLRRELAKEFTQPGQMAFFDDNKMVLAGRAAKLASGVAWAEDPPSRTRHLITNVRVTEDRGDDLDVESNFIVYRTRLKSEETTWIGSRRDVLRRNGESFLIAKRLILLEQTVLLSQNLSNFF